jgi:hypothetical protein
MGVAPNAKKQSCEKRGGHARIYWDEETMGAMHLNGTCLIDTCESS